MDFIVRKQLNVGSHCSVEGLNKKNERKSKKIRGKITCFVSFHVSQYGVVCYFIVDTFFVNTFFVTI